MLESKEYDGNNLDSILYLNYIYGGDNLIYEVYGNDELLYDLPYNTDSALETY